MSTGLRPSLGIDSFSYHRWFGETSRWEEPSPVRWSTTDFLDRASALHVEVVSLQTVYLESVAVAAMRSLATELEVRSLRAVLAWGHRDGLVHGTRPDRLLAALRCLESAAELGVDLVRIVCGDQYSWKVPVSERSDRLVPRLATLAARARQLGLAIAVENHADFRMADLVTLLGRVEAGNIGICLDLGNAVRVGDDAVDAARLAAPYTRMVHVKDLIVQPPSVGDPAAWWPTAPLGAGELPVVAALQATLRSPHGPAWFVEMANMHPDHPDEDVAVTQSLAFLRDLPSA